MSALSQRADPVGGLKFVDRLADRILLLEGLPRVLVTFAAGAVCTLALPPVNFPAAGFVGFPLLVWLLDGAGAARSPARRLFSDFSIGWLFGFGYFVAGLWWMGAAMLVDAKEFAVFIPFAVLGLPAVCAIYFGLATLLARRLWSDSAWRILALAAAFALAEYLRAVLFTGFPWNEIGVMAAPIPLMMQTLSLVGPHGLTLLAVIVFSSPAVLIDRRGRQPVLVLAIALAVFHVGFGLWRLATHPTADVAGVKVRVVQADIPQSMMMDEAAAEKAFARHVALTEKGDAAPAVASGASGAALAATGSGPEIKHVAPPQRTLVVWPESSIPFLLTDHPEAIGRIAEMLKPGETLIAGAPRLEGTDPATGRVYNSLYVINDHGEIVDARDKVHLVPFGEYLPFQSFLESLGIFQLTEMPGGFSAGAVRSRVELKGAPSFLPLICYEIIFPGEINAGTPQTRPGFLVNDTNDGWFGRTSGPYQHLRLAEMTGVAFGLPLVRAANTGISVVTDAYGREIDALALGSTGTIEAPLPQAAPPTLYARFGDWIFWFAFAAVSTVATTIRLRIGARVD
ncbi:apolipoprotein N-acyltransferase [Jiella sp. M17.18]|uniref:apolipoprotein N-acyltransferase n=1 Tax=Jiella sp. M17.18 TaxID=3234247 RepID=UPI0034DEA5BD